MKIRNTISKLITVTIALTALVVGGSAWTGRTNAEQSNANVVNTFLFSVPTFGLVPDQTARISVAHLPKESGGAAARVTTYVYDSLGTVVSRSAEVEIPAGQFRSFDFNRNDLRVEGEPGTRRLQLYAGVQIILMDDSVRTVKGLTVSRETLDNRTGSSSGGNYFTGSVTVSDD